MANAFHSRNVMSGSFRPRRKSLRQPQMTWMSWTNACNNTTSPANLSSRKTLATLVLTFSDQISALSKPCYYHICELRCLCPYLDFKAASTISTSIDPSKLDYCNSLYYNLPQSQIKRLQNIQNSLAHAVTRTPKSSQITPVLKSLHWLKIN